MIADFQKDASNLASGATSLENITSGDNDLAVLTDLFTFNIQLDSFNFCILVPLQLRNIAPVAQLVECPLRGNRMSWVWSRARHTKVFKNGTSRSSLGTQTYRVELGPVDPVSDNVSQPDTIVIWLKICWKRR